MGLQSSAANTADGALRWAVLYAADGPFEALSQYDLLVLDNDHHPELEPLADSGTTLFGYLSLGEVNSERAHFAQVNEWGILGEENPNWPGSHFVDVRDPRWVAMVIEELVPNILRKGFHGIFLDTLDNPVELERREPKANVGMRQAAARMIKALKLHWPRVPIILNRGYGLLDDVGGVIDYVLGESVYADYDFETKTYAKVEDALYLEQVAILKRAQIANPQLGILTLDYWDPADTATIAEIYKIQRANGFAPYVATVELDQLVSEPKG